MTSPGRPEAAGPEHPRIRPYLRARPAADPSDPAAGAPGADARPQSPGATESGPARPRPFVLTSGRVDGGDPTIGLETQVTARRVLPPWATPTTSLAPELQTIVSLCAYPVSVAEISARARLHLGVTRILVGDLRASGHLDIHTADAVNPTDPDTIMRVIRGLRAIS